MTRATVGNLLNYLTTIGAQVLFAKHYGSSGAAAAYAIVFGAMTVISGLLVSTVQTVVVPRLMTADGAVGGDALRWLGWVSGGALLVAAILAATAGAAATLLSAHVAIDARLLTDLIRLGAAALLLQLLAGELAAVGLARGWRLLPTLSPALPSTAVMVVLAVGSAVDVRFAYAAFTAGSLLQVALLAAAVLPSTRVAAGTAPNVGVITLATMGTLALLSFVTPLERVVAAAHSTADAARYDYALRSLGAVQSIVIGGLSLAGLGTWSALASSGKMQQLRRSLAATTVGAAVALLLTASIAVVSVHVLVSAVFQHGSFTSQDTQVVSDLVLLALPGYCAMGLVLLGSQALAATRHNAALIAIGLVNVVSRVTLILVLSMFWGVRGIAIAYSVANVAVALLLAVVILRLSLWPRGHGAILLRAVAIAVTTLAAAGLLAVAAGSMPATLRIAGVVAVFLLLSVPMVRRRHLPVLQP